MNIKKRLITLFITAALTGYSSQAMHLYQQKRVDEKQQKEATEQLITLLSSYPINIQEKDNLTSKVKELLAKGANPDGDNDSKRPLVWAARYSRHVDPARILLEHNANPNVKGYNGVTALINATQHHQVDTVRLLLEHNANPDIQDNDGDAALIVAACCGYGDTERVLLEHGAKPDIQDNRGNTPLLVATRYHHKDTARLLLAHHAKPNIKNNDGDTALLTAIKKDKPSIDIIRLLLEYGADPMMTNNHGETALFRAAQYGKTEVASQLIQSVIDQKITGLKYIRAEKDCYLSLLPGDLFQFTLKSFLIPSCFLNFLNGANDVGNTPLHVAAEYYNAADFVRLLLEHGADKTIKNNFGKTALDIAKEKSYQAIIDLLQDKPAENKSEQK